MAVICRLPQGGGKKVATGTISVASISYSSNVTSKTFQVDNIGFKPSIVFLGFKMRNSSNIGNFSPFSFGGVILKQGWVKDSYTIYRDSTSATVYGNVTTTKTNNGFTITLSASIGSLYSENATEIEWFAIE